MNGREPLPRLIAVPHGAPVREAVTRIIEAAKAPDPLAPVSVAVPSTYAGLSLRRDLARQVGGLVNVRFLSLNRIAELLGAPFTASGRRPLTPALRVGAVRAALAEVPGPFGEVAGHPATARAVHETLHELGPLPDAALTAISGQGERPAAFVALARRFRALTASYYDDEDQLLAAADTVTAGGAAVDDLGTTVVLVPRGLGPGSLAFIDALARRGRAHVVLGMTGDPDADQRTHELAARLEPSLGAARSLGRDAFVATVPAGTAVVSCPDPTEEAAYVAREIARLLLAGTPLHRVAVAYRQPEPYARLLHEQLSAAGIPFHGPAPHRLADSVAGRVLLGLLRLPSRGFRRDDVMELLTGAPVLEHPDGRVVPGPRWDGVSRAANVVAGREQWAERLAAYRATRAEHLERRAALEGTLFDPDHVDLVHTERLATFVTELVQSSTPPPRASWPELSKWVVGLLDRYVGRPDRRPTSWPEREVTALETVRSRAAALAALDELGVPTAALSHALEEELDTTLGHVGRFGDGVLVAPVRSLLGTEYDVLFVVGMTEGSFPPATRDDPVLPDAARHAGGDAVPRRADRTRAERGDYLAALSAAPERVLCFPRADTRARRPVRPARWVLETAAVLGERAVAASDLDPVAAAPERAWLRVVPSHASAVLGAVEPTTAHDLDLRSLAAWGASGRSLARHPLARQEPALADGFEAVRARTGRRLGPWEGVLGPITGVAPGPEQVLSPTALEVWAACPFRYLLSRVLRVQDLERPEERDRIHPIERGALVHEVLDEFFTTHPRHDPDEQWSASERAEMRELAERHCDAAEERGLTGRAVLWRIDRPRIVRELESVLDTDAWLRRELGTVAFAHEVGFGTPNDPYPALELSVDGTPVTFRGRIDRVDRSPDGGRIVVLDYKTGSAAPFEGLDVDPVLAGQRLQLALYALVMRRAHPDAIVDARYWFTRERDDAAARGFALDDAGVRERVEDVVTTIVSNIKAGNFPQYPGEEGFYGPTNCDWCDYRRLCPPDRVRRFERRRDDVALAGITTLREGEPDDEDTL